MFVLYFRNLVFRQEGIIAYIYLKNFQCRGGTYTKVSRKKGKWTPLKERATEFFPSMKP